MKLFINVKVGFFLLLISAIFFFYSLRALTVFYDYKNRVNHKVELNFKIFNYFLKNEFKKDKVKFSASDYVHDEKSPLKTFHLTIDQKDINKLNADLPASGKEQYIKAYLQVSDEPKKIRKIKLRYRGDKNFHWLYPQKSLRIKLKKNDIYNMEKTFNLINPPYDYTFLDILNYQISSSLNLITPDFFPARVFINGKFMGVYMYVSQVDESLLRKHKMMPGSIYYGDEAPANKNGVSTLWFNPKFWKKKAARNAEQKNNREDINYFINSISNLNQLKFYDFVNTMLDKKKYYNYFALDVIFGSEHHDYHHNHKLYFDPYKGKFEPIQWDLRFWHPYGSKDVSVYPLIEKISLNPILEYERDLIACKLMNSKFFKQKNINKFVHKLAAMQIIDLKADKLKDRALYDYKVLHGWFSEPYTMKDLNKTIRDKLWHYKVRQQKLAKIYQNAKVEHKLSRLKKGVYLLELLSSGNSPVQITIKENINAFIYKDKNFNKKLDTNETTFSKTQIIYPGRKIIDGTVEHFTKMLSGSTHIVPSPEYYSLIIKTDKKDLKISDFIFKNKITSQILKSTKFKGILKKYKNDSIHPWSIPKPLHKTKTLSGRIHVDKTLVFNKFTPIIIEPGTTFIMHPNTSIYFYAKVIAKGTKQKPIKFVALDSKRPWGLIAVQGKSTTGSKFDYVEFENGSVDTRNLIHYTAPFNIHNTDNFEVKNCFIGKNFKGDDAMHIAYSTGLVDACTFDGARSDALDIDISKVVIINNTFKNCGNDCLDIMTTKMTASKNRYINAEDKGISVGEWSEANITDSTFIRTKIGLEIKDKSEVIANNLVFIDSKDKAIHLYNKNKRYDTGGYLKATNIKYIGNNKVKVDAKSRVIINE